jgi:hypothetical protein
MADVTFRDFAAAVMRGDAAAGAASLQVLLALDGGDADAATAHFQRQMSQGGPGFMGKAMGLRTAVTSGNDAEIRTLLAECFGLVDPALERAVAHTRARNG